MNTSPISAAILSSWLLMSSAHSATTTLVIDSFLDPAGLDLSTTTGEVSEETVLLSEGTEIVGATRRIDFTVNTNPFFNDAVVEVGPREAGSILIFDTGPGVVSGLGVSYSPVTTLDVSASSGVVLDLLFVDQSIEVTIILVDGAGESFQSLSPLGEGDTSGELYFAFDQFSRPLDLTQVSEVRLMIDPDTSADFALDRLAFVAVPEPQGALLLASAAVFGLRRRRR